MSFTFRLCNAMRYICCLCLIFCFSVCFSMNAHNASCVAKMDVYNAACLAEDRVCSDTYNVNVLAKNDAFTSFTSRAYAQKNIALICHEYDVANEISLRGAVNKMGELTYCLPQNTTSIISFDFCKKGYYILLSVNESGSANSSEDSTTKEPKMKFIDDNSIDKKVHSKLFKITHEGGRGRYLLVFDKKNIIDDDIKRQIDASDENCKLIASFH